MDTCNTFIPIIFLAYFVHFWLTNDICNFDKETQAPTEALLQAPTNSNLKIDGVTYKGFKGTSNTIEAITLKCDRLGCTNIIMNNINIIASSSINGKTLTSFCSYASGKATATIPEVKCLSHK